MEREQILNRLLTRYENSKHLTQPGTSSRRVMLTIDKKELPEYDFETAAIRDRYNRAARELEEAGLVTLEWVNGRPVLARIVLELSHVEQAYQVACRVHPRQQAQWACQLIRERLADCRTPWIAAWRDDTVKALQQTMKLPPVCRRGEEHLSEFLNMLVQYEALGGNHVTARAFSVQCFQDSKRFEREFQEELLRTAERHRSELAELCAQRTMSAREKLAFLGIYTHPELYQLAGCGSVLTNCGTLDLAALGRFGVAIPSTAVDEIRSFSLPEIKRVTFIENKTNYEEYLLREKAQEELVVYHGGFFSPRKRQLMEKLAASLGEADVRFWGDIDLGGFQMFERLQTIFPRLRPMRMDGQMVERYADRGLARPEPYMDRLREALERQEFPAFHDAIRAILRWGVTIEQEVFLAL